MIIHLYISVHIYINVGVSTVDVVAISTIAVAIASIATVWLLARFVGTALVGVTITCICIAFSWLLPRRRAASTWIIIFWGNLSVGWAACVWIVVFGCNISC